MSGAPATANVDFAQYGEVFRRRWRIVALGLVLGIIVAVAAMLFLPKTYTSTASVLVAATGETASVANGRTNGEINLDTEAQIVTSTVVARLAGEELGSREAPRDLAKRVTVTVPPNTSVLDISFEADDAQEAQEGAKAFADAYLQNRSALASDSNQSRRDQAQNRIDRLNSQLDKLETRIRNLGVDDPQRASLETQSSVLVQQIGELSSQSAELDLGTVNPGNVITEAQLPRQPSDPNLKLVLASGLMVGLLLGTVLAFLRDRADRSVRDRRDLERLGLDVLVPGVVVPPKGEIASTNNARFHAESMRRLRNALLAQMPEHRGSLLVAATTKGEVGSAVALNLAATLARSGLSVILASADSQEDATLIDSRRRGLAEVLQGRAEIDDVLTEVPDEPGMRTLAPGRDGSLYTELVQSEQVTTVLTALQERADVLVVDVAPTSVNADAQTLASWFDGVVLVTEAQASTIDDVIEAVDQFQHVSAKLLGAVVATQATRPESTAGHPTRSEDGAVDRSEKQSGPSRDDSQESGQDANPDANRDSKKPAGGQALKDRTGQERAGKQSTGNGRPSKNQAGSKEQPAKDDASSGKSPKGSGRGSSVSQTAATGKKT